MRADDHDLPRMLGALDLGHRVPLRHRVLHVERVLDVRFQLRRRARLQQPVEHRVLLVRDDDLRQRQHARRRAAHVEQALLLAGVEQDAERSGVAQQERLVGVELLDAGAPRRVHRGRRAERAAELVAHALRVGRAHRRTVVVPHERRRPQHHERPLHLGLVGLEALGRAGVDAHHGAPHHLAVRAGRPRPAGRDDVVRARRGHPQPHRPPLPCPPEVPRPEVPVEAVLLELAQRPVVGLPDGRRAGQPRTDDIGEVLEVLHHLGLGHALVDQGADARGVDGNRRRGLGGERRACERQRQPGRGHAESGHGDPRSVEKLVSGYARDRGSVTPAAAPRYPAAAAPATARRRWSPGPRRTRASRCRRTRRRCCVPRRGPSRLRPPSWS